MKWTAPEVFVSAVDPACQDAAMALSEKFGLPLTTNIEASTNDEHHWTLAMDANELKLIRPDGLATEIDFLRGKAAKRTQEKSFASQPLARALGLQKLRKSLPSADAVPSVIDATAGFGTDGWMIASLGCDVRLLEEANALCAMLDHALQQHSAMSVQAIHTNAVTYLNNDETARADIIYLDPMYPATRSSALVKKGMQLLHELVGPDNNGPALLTAALTKANYRVVVKRPKGADLLQGSEQWSGQITDVKSAQTRFDVYHVATA